jgi:hypothetical protein
MRRAMLVRLYPAAWRRRYGAGLAALLEDDPPGIGGTLDLIRGALAAHLQPLPGMSAAARARSTVCVCLAGFFTFCVFGSGFAKATEDAPFTNAAKLHPLLGTTRGAIEVSALLCGMLALIAAALLVRRQSRPAVLAVAAASLCMAVTTAGVALYLAALVTDAPSLAASTNGPLAVFDTTTLVTLELAAMIVASSLALVSADRGLDGLRAVNRP